MKQSVTSIKAMPADNELFGVASTLQEVLSLKGEWEGIMEQSSGLDLFVSPLWITLWYEIIMDQGDRPALLWVRSRDGRLIGALPLVRRRLRFGPLVSTAYELAGEAVACGDHLGLITTNEDLPSVYDPVRDWLLARAGSGALVRLLSLDANTPFVTRLTHDIEMYPGTRRQATSNVAPRLTLPESYEAYEYLLSSKRRKLIRRNWRRLERDHGAKTSCVDKERSLDWALDEWFLLHDRLWADRKESTALENDRLRRFLRHFCEEAAHRGWLRMHQIRVGERLVAGTIVFHWMNRAYYYQLAWDRAFSDYGVGELVVANSIRAAIEERLSIFDFLRGSERYKTRLRAQPLPQVGIEFSGRGPGSWLVRAHGIRERIRRKARQLREGCNAQSNASCNQTKSE